MHRQVALKLLTSSTDGDTARARLLREARNAAALNHPGICTIHEIGEASGVTFIAMEYVEGKTLRDRLNEGSVPVGEAVRYGVQVADALAYAHERGVVHRDLKASNVLLNSAGRIKIVDFGLAHRTGGPLTIAATAVSSLVPPGAAAGTPFAMAPEQVRGDPTDARTDVWALGVLLYEMVGQAKPFSAATVPDLFSSILRDPPQPLPDIVPAQMRTVIERCLEKAPQRRYQNARELIAALEGIDAGAVSSGAGARPAIDRRRWLAVASAFLVSAALIAAVAVRGGWLPIAVGPPTAETIRLAVLPFENLTGDPAQEYLNDGLTEEMITRLGRLHPTRLTVIARTSSMRYKSRKVALDQIARELGVDYVLEGSVRREGNRVRIGATLVRVRDQTQRWTGSFERELAGILALQSDIALGVAKSLAPALLPAELARLAGAPLLNPEAYETYLKGLRHLWSTLSRANLDAAQADFESAVARDPTYALAYAGLAGVWIGRQQMGLASRADATPKIKSAVAKALELDDSVAEAHFRLAEQCAWTDWNWPEAGREFRRAIDLDPNDARVRALYADYLAIMKRPDEAVVQIRQALDIDPLNPQTQAFYGRILQFAQRYDEALAQYRRVLEAIPDQQVALANLRVLFHLTDRYDDALALDRAWASSPAANDRELADALTLGYNESGYRGAMRRAADRLAGRPVATTAPFSVAQFYMRAGDQELALHWLEKAFEAHDSGLPYLRISALWDTLRDEPQFRAIIRSMNLTG